MKFLGNVLWTVISTILMMAIFIVGVSVATVILSIALILTIIWSLGYGTIYIIKDRVDSFIEKLSF